VSIVVCAVEELPPWRMRTVTVRGAPVVVAHAPEGSYRAVRGICAHQGGMLGDGMLGHLISADGPGRYELSRRAEILRCPWHSYEYDIVTGRCLTDPRLRLRTYPVRLDAGNVVLDV
jgi:3-phenylpropionate/trans-cinnamate dioxygenase ferredoxin subunit